MAILPNARHERFAQALAAGKSADEAYREAGYKPSRSAASRLSANVNIQARVAELLSRVAEGVVLSRQWVIERLVENANRAMQAEAAKDSDGAPTGEYRYEGSVANRALELLGKELGMFVERQVRDENVRILSDEPIDDVEWERRYAAGPVETGAANGKAH